MAGVKAMKQTMFDEFKIKGFWWNPDKPDNKEAGILFFSESEIHLELIGSLSDGFFAVGNNEYDIVHGFSDKGEQFTLMNVLMKNSTTNSPGFQTQTFSIHSFIVGGHFNTLEEIQFHSLSFQPTYLTEWLGRHVFSDTSVFDKGKSTLSGKQVSFNHVDTFSYHVDVLDAKIEETYFMNFNTNPFGKVLWTNKSAIKVIPNENKDLLWFQTNMYLLKDLLNLFIGHATYFESILFYGEEETIEGITKKPRKKYMYFFRQDKSKLKEKFHWHDVIINFKDINKVLDQILNSWFEKQEMLEVVYDLHFGEFYKDIYIETAFLNTIQVLEIYHRKMYDGKVYDKTGYRKFSKELKEILAEKFPEKFAQLIGNKINYGNEYSLAMRVKEIISNFQESSRNILIGSDDETDKFVRQLVDTRNYLTHYDSDKKKHILLEPMQKYYAIQRLRAIATLILFLEVGLDEKLMVDKISKSKQYSRNLNKAKEVLN